MADMFRPLPPGFSVTEFLKARKGKLVRLHELCPGTGRFVHGPILSGIKLGTFTFGTKFANIDPMPFKVTFVGERFDLAPYAWAGKLVRNIFALEAQAILFYAVGVVIRHWRKEAFFGHGAHLLEEAD